jgi:hypothetical protein
MKLFLIENGISLETWEPEYLYEGRFRDALEYAYWKFGYWSRVHRMTPAEATQYEYLPLINLDIEALVEIQWNPFSTKIFVYERLKDSVWEPRRICVMDFREALKQAKGNRENPNYRIRRVETLGDLEECISRKAFLPGKKSFKGELWKIKWI